MSNKHIVLFIYLFIYLFISIVYIFKEEWRREYTVHVQLSIHQYNESRSTQAAGVDPISRNKHPRQH
jgi:hypothetical protein